jgi:hypothetical protein
MTAWLFADVTLWPGCREGRLHGGGRQAVPGRPLAGVQAVDAAGRRVLVPRAVCVSVSADETVLVTSGPWHVFAKSGKEVAS